MRSRLPFLDSNHARVHVSQSQASEATILSRLVKRMGDVCQVKKRQLYGDLVYTHDSDLVAVLMHLGYFRMMDTTPIGMVNVKAIIRVMPNQSFYPSSLRNNLLSRQWHCAQAQKKSCAYKVVMCTVCLD